MKKLLFFACAFLGVASANAEAPAVTKHDVTSLADRYKHATYAEMEKKAASFELTPTTFRLDAYTIIGKINVAPFQSYATSNVRIRSAAGISVSFKF